MATQKKDKTRHEAQQINKDLTEMNPSKEVKPAVKKRATAKKGLTMESARISRDYFETIIYKALRAQGFSKKAAENIISCYFHYQMEVEKKAKKEVK